MFNFKIGKRWGHVGRILGIGAIVSMVLVACAGQSATGVQAVTAAPAIDNAGSFEDFLASYRKYALSQGISAQTYDAAIAGIAYNPRVTEAQDSQPEFSRAFWDYLDRVVSPERITRGQDKLDEVGATLAAAERKYGVRKEVILAIWALESGYGANLGSKNVIEALATLGYRGARTGFGREQLLAALKILQAGDVAPKALRGSWAGAMGHTQFIPSTYLAYAVDEDGDGRRDIWGSLPDVFASTANYLARKGWRKGQPCFTEVRLPDRFAYAEADINNDKPLQYWIDRGVRSADGRSLMLGQTGPDTPAAILVPTGHKGPAFVAYPNFKAVLAYNQANTYALAICLLADRFEGRGGIVAAWPKSDPPLLSKESRMELQRLLAERGAVLGEADGVIGRKTRAAIRGYQSSAGLVPDGYATESLLVRLRTTQ